MRKLYGHDVRTAWQVLATCAFQFFAAWAARDLPWPALIAAAWVVSGTANQSLFCAQHEVSHFLALRKPSHNKALALVANLPLVVPMAVKFREYHHDHHIHLGVDGGDVDLPTVVETAWISSAWMKAIYGSLYLVVYGVRPLLVRPKAATRGDAVNWALVMASNALILHFWGFKALFYLFAGSILGGGLHPLAGHLLAEHYMFEPGQETYSYYGVLNALTYNVGFHNEHHDFPQIPQTRLHRLRAIAPEFYEPLRCHHSWLWVIQQFLARPDVGPWSRMHRLTKEGTPEGNARFLSTNGAYGAELPRGGAGGAAPAAEGGGAASRRPAAAAGGAAR